MLVIVDGFVYQLQISMASSYTIKAPIYFAHVIKFIHLILDQSPIHFKHSLWWIDQELVLWSAFDCKITKHIQLQARNDEFNHPNREREHDVEKGKIFNPSHFR